MHSGGKNAWTVSKSYTNMAIQDGGGGAEATFVVPNTSINRAFSAFYHVLYKEYSAKVRWDVNN